MEPGYSFLGPMLTMIIVFYTTACGSVSGRHSIEKG